MSALGAALPGIWLTGLTAASDYPNGLLGPLIPWGAGIGLTFMPLNMVILAGVPPKDTGSASGLLQCLQRVGSEHSPRRRGRYRPLADDLTRQGGPCGSSLPGRSERVS